MSTEELDRILRHTLADHRLSRGERRTLSEIVRQMGAGEHQLALIRKQVFDIARGELLGPEAKGVLDWLEDVNKVLLPEPDQAAPEMEAYFSPGDECPRRIAGLFSSARRSVDICVFTITDDRISDAIVDAKQRGIRLRVITDDEKAADEGSDVDRLLRHDIELRTDRSPYHMHHKFALFDQRRVLTGSYNWTRGADRYNEENFIVSGDPRLLAAFSTAFEGLWKRLGES
jgi:phosphatidylserine/phosphatidylglycerophosphate/cardiolipin synthase-like enzyme